MKKIRGRASEKTAINAFMFGIILTVCVFFICMLLGAFIAKSLENPNGSVGLISGAAFFVCAALCGFCISKYKGEGGVLPAALCALLFVLVLLIISLVMTGGHLPLLTLVNLVAYVAVSGISAFFGKRKDKRRRR